VPRNELSSWRTTGLGRDKTFRGLQISDLKGKVSVVTSALKGIGAAIALIEASEPKPAKRGP